MEDVESSLLAASRLVEQGQVKDAYMTFITTAQQSLQALYDIKFIHSAIVSQPKQYTALISAMRTCLTHIEHIIDSHSPSAPIPEQGKTPRPPLPPKPSRIQKPAIPPKPTRAAPSTPTSDLAAHPPRPRIPQRPAPAEAAAAAAADDMQPAVADGAVDPTHLVPAQTNAGDSLSPPSATGLHSNHVPAIPAPPLLTTHRILQARLDELDSRIKDCRQRRQQEPAQAAALDHAILQHTGAAAEVKHTLNRVRTLYMSAATVPTILQFPPHMVAYQATAIESAIFGAIPPGALLEHSAKQPHPRIVASTDFFNYFTRVIEHSILLPQDASARAQHINHWIKVAAKCLDLHNYQTLKAIVSALGTPPVQRLRRTWAYIPKKSMTKLDTLSELMSERDNYARYREHMGTRSLHAEPTVPFLGTFIHDLTYLLAAAGNSRAAAMADPRVAAVLGMLESLQKAPSYTAVPPAWFVKAAQKHHHLRPAALSSALHRSATGIGRISGSMFGGSSSSSSGGSGGGDDDSSAAAAAAAAQLPEEDSLEEQQQMITQYLLMRSWVSQTTIDELSVLREPPRQAQQAHGVSYRSTAGSTHHTSSSVISSTGSLMRFSTGSISQSTLSTNTAGSRATSMAECSPDASDDPDTSKAPWHRHSHDDDHTNKAPHIPPRPPPRREDKDFKTALAQRIQAHAPAPASPP